MGKPLTAAAVEKARPDPTRRLEIADGGLPGLYLLLQPSGRKSWALRYRAGGNVPKKLTIGAYPQVSLADAREAAREAIRAAQTGADPAAEKQARRKAAKDPAVAERDLFEAFARRYVDRYCRPKNRDWREQARLLGLAPDRTKPEALDDPAAFLVRSGGLVERWRRKRVQDITRGDIMQAIDDEVARGAPIGANRVLAAVRKALAWGVDRGILTDGNPAATVKAPTPETRGATACSTTFELGCLWRAAGELGRPFDGIVKLLILTGQRRDEVGQMPHGEIRRGERLWVIPKERAKNGIENHIHLTDAALAVLDSVPRVAGPKSFVFSTTGKTAVSGYSNNKTRLDRLMLAQMKKLAKEKKENPDEVELAHWTLHDIRRTVASGMARLGINLPVIEKVLNHTSGSFAGIVGVYQRHSFAEEKKKALETWANFVLGLVAEKPANVVQMKARA